MRITANRQSGSGILICCLLIVCLPAYISLSAQTIPFKQYTGKDGLANSVVFRMVQDKRGYIWIATNYGLSRFDGSQFFTYDTGLMRTTLLAIGEDRNGTIWASASPNGLFRINGDSAVPYQWTGPSFTEIAQLVPDVKDRIWAVNVYHKTGYFSNNRFYPYHIPGYADDEHAPDVYQAITDADGENILLATSSGLFSVNEARLVPDRLKHVPLYSFTMDAQGRLYAGSEGRIYTLQHGRLDSISARKGEQIRNMRCDRHGAIWYTTAHPGLFVAGTRAGQEVNYAKLLGLGQVFINDMLITHDGALVFGTYGKGLYVTNRPNLIRYDASSGLLSDLVMSITEDGAGTIYAAGFNGVAAFRDDRFVPISAIKLRPDEQVNHLLVYRNQLWVAGSHRIYRYDLHNGNIQEHFPGANRLSITPEGQILAAGYLWTELLHASGDISRPGDTILGGYPHHTRVFDALSMGKGEYWLATAAGLYHAHSSGIRKHIINTRVNALVPYKNGVYAAGINGLVYIDSNDTIHHYRLDNNQSLSFSTSLLLFNDTLLIGSYDGVYALERNRLHAYNSNGLPDEKIHPMHMDSKGRLWVGTVNGLYRWALHEESQVQTKPALLLRSIKSGEAVQDISHDDITLPYRHRAISINYDVIDYRMPEHMVFEYRMRGMDSSWYKTDSRTIRYARLPPGDYNFDLRARYTAEPVYSKTATVSIHVLYPFWQALWFILLAGLTIIAAGFVAVRYYVLKLQNRERRKTQRYVRLLQLKQQAANTLLNSHFIFNSLNSIQRFINKSDSLSANRYLSRFARLIRMAMENATSLTISLEEELKMIELYLSLEAMRLSGRLSYSIEVSKDINQQSIIVPSMLIQPHVENAVWHGISPKTGAGTIQVIIRKIAAEFLEITIVDDGGGIKERPDERAAEHRPMGISLTKQRIDIIEKLTGKKPQFSMETIYDEQQAAVGTKAVLLIPVREH